jgi:NhaA family Na+:H+ antiporter
MVFPAVIYLVFNLQEESIRGWGIPIATDIAFALAILTLLGDRVPVSLKVFLLTLAIADDIGAIIVIALFYAEIIHYGYLFASVAIVSSLFLLRKFLADKLVLVVLAGVLLWVTTHLSGIHASIVGAAMGLLAPISARGRDISVAERIEKFLLPITTFVVLPVFAFANAGFVFSGQAFSEYKPVVAGIILGLVVGKAAGITFATWFMVRAGIAELPEHARWGHIVGIGLIAGIGFTVSIFITELAFAGDASLIDAAKISIFIASILSGLLGTVVLLRARMSRAD